MLSTFHKLYILGPFGDGEGGGDPCPIFFGTLAFKKSGTSCTICPNWGEGGSADVLSGRHFVRTALDVLSGRRFVRTSLDVLSGPICATFFSGGLA